MDTCDSFRVKAALYWRLLLPVQDSSGYQLAVVAVMVNVSVAIVCSVCSYFEAHHEPIEAIQLHLYSRNIHVCNFSKQK